VQQCRDTLIEKNIVSKTEEAAVALKRTSTRCDTRSARKSRKTSSAKSRTETTKLITNVVALQRFKDLMKKNAGELKFASE
jgi:hypothetical protein